MKFLATDENIVDDLQTPLAILESLCDFACISGSHEKVTIDANSLSHCLGTVISMINVIIEKERNA